MSRATTTHQEKPRSEKPLLERVLIAEARAAIQKTELAKIRAFAADLFFSMQRHPSQPADT